jgi:hypothetical protein
VGVEIYARRERKRGEMMPKDSMPLIRLGMGYLYANVSYSGTSTLYRKLARRRRIKL